MYGKASTIENEIVFVQYDAYRNLKQQSENYEDYNVAYKCRHSDSEKGTTLCETERMLKSMCLPNNSANTLCFHTPVGKDDSALPRVARGSSSSVVASAEVPKTGVVCDFAIDVEPAEKCVQWRGPGERGCDRSCVSRSSSRSHSEGVSLENMDDDPAYENPSEIIGTNNTIAAVTPLLGYTNSTSTEH